MYCSLVILIEIPKVKLTEESSANKDKEINHITGKYDKNHVSADTI